MLRLLLGMAILAATALSAHADEDGVKLGGLNDQGSSYAAIGGQEVVATVPAAEAFRPCSESDGKLSSSSG